MFKEFMEKMKNIKSAADLTNEVVEVSKPTVDWIKKNRDILIVAGGTVACAGAIAVAQNSKINQLKNMVEVQGTILTYMLLKK